MARQELQRRLEELDMSPAEARSYGELLAATQTHMLSLHDLLERELYYVFKVSFTWNIFHNRPRCEGRGAGVDETSDGRRARR